MLFSFYLSGYSKFNYGNFFNIKYGNGKDQINNSIGSIA